MQSKNYMKLVLMTIISFLSMYVLMYAMVNNISNVYLNINKFYMAGLMTAPMVICMILLMDHMYRNKKLNAVIITVSTVVLVGFFFLIRQQSAVSDKQFLKSMIPHHSSAILMCEKADIKDPRVKALCESIISGQQKEIDQMKAILKELKD